MYLEKKIVQQPLQKNNCLKNKKNNKTNRVIYE